MGRASKTKEVILALKEVREDRGLSVQRIHMMVESSGAVLSLATVKRVFAPGSEDQNFRYEDSIKPIADALLFLNEARQPEDETPTGAALRDLIGLKNAIIEEKTAEVARVQAEAQRKIDFLKAQIGLKDEQLEHRTAAMQERWKLIERQFAEIDELKARNKELEARLKELMKL